MITDVLKTRIREGILLGRSISPARYLCFDYDDGSYCITLYPSDYNLDKYIYPTLLGIRSPRAGRLRRVRIVSSDGYTYLERPVDRYYNLGDVAINRWVVKIIMRETREGGVSLNQFVQFNHDLFHEVVYKGESHDMRPGRCWHTGVRYEDGRRVLYVLSYPSVTIVGDTIQIVGYARETGKWEGGYCGTVGGKQLFTYTFLDEPTVYQGDTLVYRVIMK